MNRPVLFDPANARDRVVVFLLFMTSEKCRLACADRIPAASLAYELCKIWFDDIYTPGRTYLFDGLKGDVAPDRVEAFEDAFSLGELEQLERFHAFLDLRMDMLRPDARRHARVPQNQMWENILRDATYLLEDLDPDYAHRQSLLEQILEQVIHDPDRLPEGFQWHYLPG
jgi:hypothetical protein